MSKNINNLIELFRESNPSEFTIDCFYEWLVSEKLVKEKEEELAKLWDAPNEVTKEEAREAFGRFKSKLEVKQPRPRRGSSFMNRYAGYAAAVIALVVAFSTTYLLMQEPAEINYVEYYSETGEVKTVNLPDGSVVELNSQSLLVYPEDFGEKSRTLYMVGEAYFKVFKNEEIPFAVKSKQFTTTALGTEFNITSYANDNYYKATLLEGSVKVEDSSSEVGHTLIVGEQFAYNRGTSEYSILDINLNDETAWLRGELVFRGFTISDIIKELERNYNVMFNDIRVTPNDDKYQFRFRKQDSLEKVLDVIKNVADDFNYRLKDGICYIY